MKKAASTREFKSPNGRYVLIVLDGERHQVFMYDTQSIEEKVEGSPGKLVYSRQLPSPILEVMYSKKVEHHVFLRGKNFVGAYDLLSEYLQVEVLFTTTQFDIISFKCEASTTPNIMFVLHCSYPETEDVDEEVIFETPLQNGHIIPVRVPKT